MKKIVTLIAALALGTAAAQAAPPTAEQRDEFYKVCFSISENAELCNCKADAALTLIDSDFMAIVVAAMKGKTPPDGSYVAYNEYVAQSNKICKPNY
ncbi:MAG: hypothetical protein EOP22_02505 [Hyphomicrobiales bacterium]|nr:MAG: hypothetical protein EOP22_02505 [Hyphomicrobiales bacterium]